MKCLIITLIVLGLFAIPESEPKSVDKTSIGHSNSVQRQMSSQDDQDDHDLDSACRTIYESDKAALLAIQGATDSILKVIDKMDVESRPTRPVSAFIKVPKQLEADKNGQPTQSMQNTIASQLVNKEGFTISYNDKLSLEAIKTAAEEIKTQLLHLDLAERLIKPRPVIDKQSNQSANKMSNSHQKKRRTRSFHRRSRGENLKESGTNSSTNLLGKRPSATGIKSPPKAMIRTVGMKSSPNAMMNCENIKEDLDNIQHVVKTLHDEIDDVGRKLREEYVDNSNLERTDIKSASDNLKKLQGMLSITNHTVLAELLKVYEENTKAHSYFEKELIAMESILMKLYLASVDKKLSNNIPITGTNRVAKSIDEIGNEDGREEKAENADDYTDDASADDSDDDDSDDGK